MWNAPHLAVRLCALRHWKRVSMPPTTQSLRHPLTRAFHFTPRIKTARRFTAKNPVGTWYFTSAHNCDTILIINHLSRTRSIASLPCKIVREIDANSNVSTHWKHSKRTVHLVWFNLHLNLKRNHFIIEGGAMVFIVGAYMITNVSHSIKPGDVETESAAVPQLPNY